jgi:hypothetical protein
MSSLVHPTDHKTPLRTNLLPVGRGGNERAVGSICLQEKDYEYFPTIPGCFVLGCRYFFARSFCDGQYFYLAVRLIFGNKRGN